MAEFTWQNQHLLGLIHTLKEQHEKSMKASGDDLDAPLAVDSERMDFARRWLNGICGGAAIEAEDAGIEPSGSKKTPTEGGFHGNKDAAPTTSSEEVARGDSTRRASDSRRPAFDTRYAVDSIFNAPPTEFHAGHSVDSVFGRGSGGDGSQLDHSFASVFKPAPKLAEG